MCIFKRKKKNNSDNSTCTNEKTIKYITNTPVNNYAEYKNQVKILEFAIMEDGVYNIGIIAPYGSGKSSLIKTFLENKTVYKDVSFNITLANFKESNTTKSDSDGEEDETGDQNFELNQPSNIKNAEKSILEQLLYSVGKNKVPESGIKRIFSKKLTYFSFAFIFVSFVTLFLFSLIEFYNVRPRSSIYNFYWILPFLLVSFIGLLYFIPKLFKTIKVSYGNIEIGLKSSNDESILNEFIDEIIYFFKQTNIKIVFFEDIDRFDSVKLISKLREINQIINSNEFFKNESKKIKFVYCVRDDLFNSPIEKAKFFDFVVPLYPILTVENVQQIIESTIREAECVKEEDSVSIDLSFIGEVSYFLKDKRVIDNIVNDYEFLRTNLNTIEDNNKLFAMMIFKNLFMKEYYFLQRGEGRLYSIFHDDKNKAINNALEKLTNEKNELEQKLNSIPGENEKNKKKEIINAIKGIVYSNGITTSAIQSNYVSAESLESSFDNNIQGIYVNNRTPHPYSGGSKYFAYSIDLINSLYGKNIFDALEEVSADARNKTLERIEELTTSIEKISNYNVKQLLDKKYFDESKIKEIDKNGFLIFALKNGYIDETYFMYIGELDSQLDTDLIIKIISESDIDSLTVVDNPLKVINKLNIIRFRTKQILICSIVKELLSTSGVPNKKEAFLDYLSTRTPDTKKFVAVYCANNFDILKLISAAHKKYKYIVFDILDSDILSVEQKNNFVLLLYHNKLLSRYNNDDCISNFVKTHNSPISSIFANFDSVDDIFDVLKKLNIEKIENLSYNKTSAFEKTIFDAIVRNSMYEINDKNLTTIYDIKDEISLSSIFDKNEYLQNNKVLVLKSLVGHRVKFVDNEKTAKEILIDASISLELRQSYVELLKSVPYIEKLDHNIYYTLLNCNKCKNWSDLIKLSKVIPDFDYNHYILNNYKDLNGEIVEKPLFLKFVNSDLENEEDDLVNSVSSAISSTIKFSYSEIIKDTWLASLIDKGYIVIDKSLLVAVAKKPKSLKAILKNDSTLVEELGKTNISKDEYLALIDSDLPKSTRRSIILNHFNYFVINELSKEDFEMIVNLICDGDYKNDVPYELIERLYGDKNIEGDHSTIIREKAFDLVCLNQAYLLVKLSEPELYKSLSNYNNPVKEIKLSCSQYENNNVIRKLIELKLIVGNKKRKDGKYYIVNVAKLFNIER